MLTQWLQPIPEKNYIRVVYCGKLRLVKKEGRNQTLEEMIGDIWKRASVFNRRSFISGHLSCSKTLHVVQLLEGKQKVVLSLMERIRKDPRVVIEKEFIKEQCSMNAGWDMTMCYSFDITSAQMGLVQDKQLTLQEMFDMMKNTHQVRKEGWNLPGFYKHIIETILLKFISLERAKQAM